LISVFAVPLRGFLAYSKCGGRLTGSGFTVSRGYFWTIIRKPIYCGKIFTPAYKNEEAHFVKSVHHRLQEEEED
jgi:hypothetical protein